MALKPLSFYSLFLTAFLLAGSASAESKWTHMRSENLEMFSETTAVRSQETLRAFEQIRAFLMKSVGTSDAVLGSTCIVAFKTEEDFAHFRPKADTISFPVSGADRDYVVLGLPEAGAFEPGARAYAGLLSRQLGLRPPAWLEDGLNLLYATFTTRGSAVIAGELTPGRRKALMGESWGSLDQVLTAEANNRTLSNQRFALVHMLMLSSDYAPKFKDLLAELQSGTAAQAALEKVYAKPLSALEKDLKAYVGGPSFTGVSISSRSEAPTVSPAEPAAPFDVNLALAGVVNQPGRENDGKAWLDRLAGTNPERPEPWAGLGYIALRRGQTLVAAQNFEKAISLGSRDPGVLWTRSRIALADSPLANSNQDTEESVRALLDKEPGRVDLRVRLAALALDQRRPGLAYRLLEPIRDVPADLTPRYLAELAYAQLETGEQSAAKLTVARLEDRGVSPADKADATRLKDFLAGPTRLTLGSNKSSLASAGEQEKAAAEKAEVEARAAAEARNTEARKIEAREAEARDAEASKKELAEAREKATAEAREKAEARAREKAEAEQRQQAEVAARVKAELEAKTKAAAEAQEKKEARAREKAEREAQTKAIADARQRAVSEAHDKALAEAAERQEAKAREKAAGEARAQAAEEARQKNLGEAREKAAAAAREKVEAREKAAAEAREKVEARTKAEEARQKPEPAVLAQAAKETRATAEAYSVAAQPQQASNLVPESTTTPAPAFPAMLTGSFVELGCGDQIKVVVQTEQGRKNFRIKNPANVIVSSKGGGTVDLNCGPQKPTTVRIQFGPGEGGFDGLVEAIYFE